MKQHTEGRCNTTTGVQHAPADVGTDDGVVLDTLPLRQQQLQGHSGDNPNSRCGVRITRVQRAVGSSTAARRDTTHLIQSRITAHEALRVRKGLPRAHSHFVGEALWDVLAQLRSCAPRCSVARTHGQAATSGASATDLLDIGAAVEQVPEITRVGRDACPAQSGGTAAMSAEAVTREIGGAVAPR
jgi:hypothetical protein